MRTNVLLAKTHAGAWELLADPDSGFLKTKAAFRDYKGKRSDDQFALVVYQESDGHQVIVKMKTKADADAHDAQRKKEDDAAKATAEADLKRTKDAFIAAEKKRLEERQKELSRLNEPAKPIGVPTRKLPAPPTNNPTLNPPKNADGLRTDGPTPEEWTAAGYDLKTYPPEGFAAKPSVATTETPKENSETKDEN